MNKIVNTLKKIILAGLIVICGNARAQSDETFSAQVMNMTLKPDTGKAAKSSTLFFTLNVKKVSELRSFTVLLVDKDDKTVIDLGEFESKKHDNGFYYVENRAKEKMTVLNSDIYFSKKLKEEDLLKVKSLRLNYQSTSGQQNIAKKELPAGK